MSKWNYRKTEPSDIRGICVICNKNPQKKANGNKYKAICSPCDKRLYDENRNRRITETKRKHRRFVKELCEKCGFIPEHICQLDVHHLDRNHNNNAPNNLKTLCANCHRLEHK